MDEPMSHDDAAPLVDAGKSSKFYLSLVILLDDAKIYKMLLYRLCYAAYLKTICVIKYVYCQV